MTLSTTRWRVRRALPLFVVTLVGACSLVTMPPVAGNPFQKQESFDEDPQWDGFNNELFDEEFDPPAQIQDFKFNPDPGFAVGIAPGVAGGKMRRDPLAFYADNVGALDPSTTVLTMSGQGIIACTADPLGGASCDTTPKGNALVGWFNKFSDLEWESAETGDFIGLYTDETARIELHIAGLTKIVENGEGFELKRDNIIELDEPFTYDITYDPLGGSGTGAVTGVFEVSVDFDGDGSYEFDTFSATIAITASQRDAMNDFNRHGLLTRYQPFADNIVDFYIDDIEYTADDPIPDPTDYVWTANGAGDWNRASNWNRTNFVPGENTQTAVLGDAIASASTVYTDSPVTVKGIRFDNEHSYGISGGGSVNLEADVGSTAINVLQGSHEFQLPVNLVSDAQVMAAAGASVAFDNALNLGEKTLTKVGDGTMLVNNLDRTGTGTIALEAGTLGGGGGIAGDLNNTGGIVAPGESAGTLMVDGNFTQAGGGTLAIGLGGTADGLFDVLDVSGTAVNLDGLLDISLIVLFSPTLGDTFDVLTASSVSLDGLGLSGQSGFTASVEGGNTLRLTYTGGLPGDADGDGDVDGQDFLLLQVTNPAGIPEWQTNFGTVEGQAAAAAVPEPAGLALAGVALIGAWGWFRKGGYAMRHAFGRINLWFGFVCVGLAGFIAADTAQAQPYTKVELFDNNPSWDAVNNDQGFPHQFGYGVATFGLPTDFAGGDPGEIGGLFTSKGFTTPSYYADDIGTLNPAVDALTATGKAATLSEEGFLMLGWFDKDSDLFPRVDQSGSRNDLNFLGFLMDDDRFFLLAGGNEAQVGDALGTFATDFAISYDPNANAGGGALMGTVGGQSNTVFLPPGFKEGLEDFDRFGLLANEDQEIDPARNTEWYFDNLTYTTSIFQPPITEVEWASDASGNAAAASFWNPPRIPDENVVTAILGQIITEPRTVFADTPLIMNALQIDNANQYTVAGQGTLTLEADAGNAAIEVLQGSHEFQINVILGSDTDVTVPSGEALTFNNGLDLNGFTLTNLGPGELVVNNRLDLNGGQFNDPGGTVVINAAVPEPSTLVLLAVGLAGVAWRRRAHELELGVRPCYLFT